MPRTAVWLRSVEVEVLTGPKGKGCRVLSRTRSQHRRYYQGVGLPARESSRAWIYELHPELHTRVVGRSDGLARPPAMKQAAVIALCTRHECAHAVAQKLGVCRLTLYNWKNQLLGPEASASMKRRQQTPSSPERKELERQLESLRLDVRRLQLEHELLMRASELIKKRRASIGKS
ncbi:hypothetical protein SAMN03159512_03016 [Pseudomonas sp. NFR09]|nr:hypothetical protein SAMN03159512_03016 [Pseudomonas sp. NFR09]